MIRILKTLKVLVAGSIALLFMACSTTTLVGSWSDPDTATRISKPYIIGISKNDTRRRIFEDSARNKLMVAGAAPFTSYNDLPVSEDNDKALIAEKATANGADSVLIVRVIDRKTKQFVNPGRVSGYVDGPVYRNRNNNFQDYVPEGHYADFGSYYAHSYQLVYEPPTEVRIDINTVEATLYDIESEKLIWSGQFEVVKEASFEKQVDDFLDAMTGDLKKRGLI